MSYYDKLDIIGAENKPLGAGLFTAGILLWAGTLVGGCWLFGKVMSQR